MKGGIDITKVGNYTPPVWALCVCCNSADYCHWNDKMAGYVCAECKEYWEL